MESKSIQQLKLILLTLEDIDASITHLKNWNAGIQDFLALEATEEGLQKLAADAMLIEAIGEGIKQLDKRTEGKLFSLQPNIPWHLVMGMRDKIAHGYFDLDIGYIEDVILNDIDPLQNAIKSLMQYVKELINKK
ncbi:MAG: DUF86 domain-containing protein [Bacteroidales bacterium]|nr:DUF86 domain-containing protein [Candidatus Colicola caccequi]